MSRKSLRLLILTDPKKTAVGPAVRKFIDFAKNKAEIIGHFNLTKCSPKILKSCDFAVVFGGDGSIIAAARLLSKSRVPVIGINLGKLGYLAEFSVSEIKKYFNDIISEKISVEKRMMLNCRLLRGGREIFSSKAVNDVFVTAGPPFRMIELKIKVDGLPLAGCVSDGLIIATPTGSTAYNLSAGGPIISPKMEAVVVTAICPHSLSFRPIVINADSKIEVVGLKVNDGTTVSIDGQISHNLKTGDQVLVGKDQDSFLVVNNPIRNEWDTLAAKLGWAEKPKYKNS